MTEVVLDPLRCFRRLTRALRREDGNSLIETALILPVLFLMIFGFIEFSLMIFGIGNTNFASRAALRYATLHSGTSYSATTQQDLSNIVRPYVFSFPANTWSITSSYPNGNIIGSGVYVTVTITYNLNILGYTYNGIRYSNTGVGSILQ